MTYTLDELHKLPEKYRPNEQPETGLDQACGGVASNMETEAPPLTDKRERIATARRRINPQNNTKPQCLILPGERLRVTASGLLFSGPTAYPSNLFKIPIKYQEKDYNSNEQAYQYKKAKNHERDDLDTALMQMTETHDIKDEASNIEVSDEWNESAPDLLMELFDVKKKQHPQLLERSADSNGSFAADRGQ